MNVTKQACLLLQKTTSIAIWCLLINFTVAAQATQKEHEAIDKVVQAYGGDALIKARNIVIYDNYKRLYVDQGQRADTTEVYKNNISLIIDFENRRKNFVSWENKERGDRLTKTTFNGEVGRIYDLYHQTFVENNQLNYANVGGNVLRSHDTLLAHQLWQQRESVRYLGEVSFRATAHVKLQIKTEAGLEMTLFIDLSTGFISKMKRYNQYVGELDYLFSNHRQKHGVTYAADLQFNIAGQPQLISTSRAIKLNQSLENVFDQPQSFTKRGETIDTSKMNVWELDKGVYLTGQGHRFSLFIDVGDYFVAAGGNSGLMGRYEALKAQTKLNKPLKYQVVTHHHSDHIAGMDDALKLGAKFVLVAEHVAPLKKALKQDISEDKFVVVDDKMDFGNGIAKIHRLSSTHSEHNLLLYAPKAKVMFTSDHFSSDLKTDLPNADKGTVILRKEVVNEQLDIEKFVGAHGARVLTIQELHDVADSYTRKTCPPGVNVCQ